MEPLDPNKCKPNVLDRFWNLTDRTGQCWIWKGTKSKQGYGGFTPYTNCTTKAHRFIDIALNGPMNPGECTLHRCDTPSCVRPSHLFRGTVADNNHDRSNKGRYNGEMNPKAKLTADSVRDIRSRHAEGETLVSIAESYNMTDPTIHAIVHRNTWKHIA